uniref:Haloacid dehalogenase-like hydrolase domain-containing protein 3 n=1 Tax=Chrysemys picta bellii TaxID=8478 RepID=A0A8C3I1X7_CHRPI
MSHRSMLQLRLLTWDVKDTLLRLRHPVGENYSAAARVHEVHVQPEALNKSFHQAYKTQSKHFPNYGLSQGLSSKQLTGVHEDRLLATIAESLYQEFCSAQNWELLPGARETLRQCHQLGIRMAVISNFDQRLEKILSHCNLRHHFEFVLTSEEAGFAKPDQRIFQKALHISGVAPHQAAHVGDNYVKDYRAARDVGMHSFLLTRAGRANNWELQVPKQHVLPSLTHLLSQRLLERSTPQHLRFS